MPQFLRLLCTKALSNAITMMKAQGFMLIDLIPDKLHTDVASMCLLFLKDYTQPVKMVNRKLKIINGTFVCVQKDCLLVSINVASSLYDWCVQCCPT